MVYNALFITAELDGLTNLQPLNGFDDPDHPYFFKLKCENCGEISQKPSCVIMSEQVPLPNGRGAVHLIQKCKMCDREGTVEIISGQGNPLTEYQGQNRLHTQLVVFDCHGLSPVQFSFGGLWKAQSTKGKTVFEMDLSKGRFDDFDASGKCAVSVSNLRSFFKVVNKLRYWNGKLMFSERCGRVGTVKMISDYGKPLTRVLGKSSRCVQIMIFECNGLVPVEYSFDNGWRAQSSKRLCHIDLSKGEFTDDDGKGTVEVTGLKAKFEVVNCLCRNRHIYS